MTTDADDTRLQPAQTKAATVGHTTWQVAAASAVAAVVHNFGWDLTVEQSLAVVGLTVPLLTFAKTVVVATMGSRSTMAQQLQDLQEQLEQLQ